MSGKLAVITGPMFSGKCNKKGTEIIMYSGKIKKVEDVIVGDLLMGDNSMPRTVLNINNGFGPMYRVIPTYGDPYVVNDKHILSLKATNSNDSNVSYISNDTNDTNDTIDMCITDYISQNSKFKSQFKGYHVGVDFPSCQYQGHIDPYDFGFSLLNDDATIIPDCYIINEKDVRLHLLAGILDNSGNIDYNTYYVKCVNKNLGNQIIFVVRSLGMVGYYTGDIICILGNEIPCRVIKNINVHTNKDLLVDLLVERDVDGEYFGFTLDGNGRYLLSDFMVTHNSSELQRRVRRMELAGKKCLVIKHAIDKRYGKDNECCTHDLRTMPAIPTGCLWDVKELCNEYDVVGIDESQFFPEIVEFVEELVGKMNKIVIVAALDGTYQNKPFGRIHELLHNSEEFTKLLAVCKCGNDAPFTVRKPDFVDDHGSVEVVGAGELYESVCRTCLNKRPPC